jgi:hypothetical protein
MYRQIQMARGLLYIEQLPLGRGKTWIQQNRGGERRGRGRISASSDAMFAIIHLLATFIADLFKSPRRLEVENLFLRHQLNVALRRAPQRVRLRTATVP